MTTDSSPAALPSPAPAPVSAPAPVTASTPITELAIGTTVLAGVTCAIVMAALQARLPELSEFVGKNTLDLAMRRTMMRVTLGAGALVAVGVAGFGIATKLRHSAAILRWAKIASPLLVLAFVPSLFRRGVWGEELKFFGVLAVATIVVERLAALSLAEIGWRPRFFSESERGRKIARWLKWAPLVLVCAAIVYYAFLISHYTLVTHVRMATATTDLGEYDNQFFNSLHGHPFRLPASEGNLKDWSALKFHADFIIYFLLPFYALKPGPENLLIMQTVLVAGTALPIYLFGARRVPRWIAALIAISFLNLPVIQRPNFYDFHAVPIGMFFIAWTIWAADRIVTAGQTKLRDYVFFWAAFVLACASREDIAFGMVVVSLVLLVHGKAFRLGAAMLVISTAYFVAIKFVIMPRIGVVWYHVIYDDLKAAGFERYGAVVATLLTNPVFALKSIFTEPKIVYALHMLVPLAFLWVRRPYLLAAALPAVFFTLMVTNRPPMFQTSFQYTFGWFPYIVIASIMALEKIRAASPLGNVRQTAAALALGFAATSAGYQYGVLLGGKTIIGGFGEKRLVISEREWARYRDIKAIAAQIPPDASVAATNSEGPHVSTRLILYNLGYGLGDKPDYILFNIGLAPIEAQRVREVLERGEYGVLDRRGPFVLCKRGHDTGQNAAVIDQIRR